VILKHRDVLQGPRGQATSIEAEAERIQGLRARPSIAFGPPEASTPPRLGSLRADRGAAEGSTSFTQ
jgi:hypothetical protein